MTAVLPDAETRTRAEGELDTSFVVEAAAGSGKTTVLVRRLVALAVDRGVPLRRIVATTFTDRAAGEITLRLRQALEEKRAAKDPQVRARAEQALHEMEDARIGTLHGIAGELLREVPLFAGIDPEFVVLGGDEARALRERVVRSYLGELLASPPEGLRRWLRRPRERDDGGPIHRLTLALEDLAEQRDLSTPWQRPAGFVREAAIAALLDGARSIVDRAGSVQVPARDGLAESIAELGRRLTEWTAGEAHAPRDHDALEVALSSLRWNDLKGLEKTGRASAWSDKRAYGELKGAMGDWLAARKSFVTDANAELAALLRAELWPAIARYEALKKKDGVLDFHDLTAVLLRTLRTRPEARRHFHERIAHVVVDEVQDSDPVQLDVIALLASGDPDQIDPENAVPAPGKLFVVGDPKQSIYGFRRSSVDGYLRFKERMVKGGVVPLTLSATFRCAPSIARIVDRALGAAFVPGPFQPAYVSLQPVREEAEQPTVVALPVAAPYGYRGDVHQQKVREQLPTALAAFVHFLLHESGWTVEEDGARVPIAARHVALLGRSLVQYGSDLVGPIARALEHRGIAHTHVGGRSFHAEEEIAHLRAVLRAIEWPDDELSVYATLRGPLLAHADADLFTFRALVGALSPVRVPEDREALGAEHRAIAASLDLLRELHHGRTKVPVAETLSRLLARTSAWISLASAERGELLLLRVQRLLELAAEREARGALSFRRFVLELEDAAERGDDVSVSAPSGLDAVRFSSVHLAKGLEFPVVILFDPTTSAERPAKVVDAAKGLYVDRFLGLEPAERRVYEEESAQRGAAEGARLLYVAATRARDLLVVPTTGDGPLGGWLSPLEAALRPEEPRRPTRAPRCPDFGPRTVLARGDHEEFGDPPAGEVAPGLFSLSHPDGPARVVYWDPELLTRGGAPRRGLRRAELFAEVKGEGPLGSRQTHEHFVRARRARIESSVQSDVTRVLLHELGVDSRAEAACVLTNDELEPLGLGLAPSAGLPSTRGARLVQAALEGWAAGGERSAKQRVHGEAGLTGASTEEIEATLAVTATLAAHPDLGPMVERLRPTPFVMFVTPHLLVEGRVLVADVPELGTVALAVHAGIEPADLAGLRLRLAATAHQKATGKPVRAVLVHPFEGA